MFPRQSSVDACIQDGPGLAPGFSDEVLALPGHDAVDDEEMLNCLGLGVDGLEVDDGVARSFFPTDEFLHDLWRGLVVESLVVAIPEGHWFIDLTCMEEGVVSVPLLFCDVLT